eukprot:CAMPEP_0198275810 /NCGR_PEP_ID=MMETSP1447-20131203/64967_1 /TAXON_ID=420782 /ORGANISM="Chaetoceros dichaeta, Strain CCMP1751" /LENGTH=230 /DNA_ID=CAMNT_0043970711 /DNA_START=872 /DNA_END=1564 /DNA_ORIENTATION=+
MVSQVGAEVGECLAAQHAIASVHVQGGEDKRSQSSAQLQFMLPKQTTGSGVDASVGAGVGTFVGPPPVVPDVGTLVGSGDGSGVGADVGTLVGPPPVVPSFVGADVGTLVGADVGTIVGGGGSGVGSLVGADVGTLVGSGDGSGVGADVGTLVGADVGTIVGGGGSGSGVGPSVGTLVGSFVGASVGGVVDKGIDVGGQVFGRGSPISNHTFGSGLLLNKFFLIIQSLSR